MSSRTSKLIVVFDNERDKVRSFKTVASALKYVKSGAVERRMREIDGNVMFFATVGEIGDIYVGYLWDQALIVYDQPELAIFERVEVPEEIYKQKEGDMRQFYYGDAIDGDRFTYYMVKKIIMRLNDAEPATITKLIEKIQKANLDFKPMFEGSDENKVVEYVKAKLSKKKKNLAKPVRIWELKTKAGIMPQKYEMRGDRGELYEATLSEFRDKSWELVKTKTYKGSKPEVIVREIYPTWSAARAAIHGTRNFSNGPVMNAAPRRKILDAQKFVDMVMKYRPQVETVHVWLKHISNIVILKDHWQYMYWEANKIHPPFTLNIFEYWDDVDRPINEREGNQINLTAPVFTKIEARFNPPLPDGTTVIVLDPTRVPK